MIEDLIRRAADEDDDAIEELGEIAAADPQRLSPYHGALLDLDLLWPATLYRAAGADVVGRVIEQVDGGRTPDRLNHLLLILAHSAHPLAEDALRRWSTHPPAGADDLHVGVLSYAAEGGWTIGPDGNRRDLCADVAYRWVMRDAPASRRPIPPAPGARPRSGSPPTSTPPTPPSAPRWHTPAGPAAWSSRPATSAPATRRCTAGSRRPVPPPGGPTTPGRATWAATPDRRTRRRCSRLRGRPWRARTRPAPGTRAAPPWAADPTGSRTPSTPTAPGAGSRWTTWA